MTKEDFQNVKPDAKHIKLVKKMMKDKVKETKKSDSDENEATEQE